MEECETVAAYSSDNYQPLLWRYYRNDRRTLFRLINKLKLASTSQDQALMDAVSFLLKNENRRSEWLPDEVDLSFVSERQARCAELASYFKRKAIPSYDVSRLSVAVRRSIWPSL